MSLEYWKSNQPVGFSLIELMVVVVIVLVLTSLGLAGYNQYNHRQKIKQAALSIETNLRLVQKKAISGDKEGSCASAQSLSYWGLSCSSSTGCQQTYACQSPNSSGTIDLSLDLPSSGYADGSVQFAPLTGMPQGGAASFVVTDGESLTENIRVNAVGVVEVQ